MKECMKKVVCVMCAIIMLTLSGCAGASADSPNVMPSAKASDADVPTRDTIIIATESEPPSLHPFDHKSVTASFMNKLTYDYLFVPNFQTLEPEPSLVKEYSNPTQKEWLFTIHDNVEFHNGSKMTAEDVKASMDYARTFTTTKDYTAFWSDVSVVDEYTIKVTTNEVYALVLNSLCNIRVLPKDLIEAEHDFYNNPIGSGPYKFVEHILGDSLEFEKNDNYFNEEHQPSITKMLWRIIPEGSSRTIALEAGEVDVVIEVATASIERLKAAEDIELVTVRGTRVNFLAMNSEEAPFDNKLFRRAVNAAIDKEAVVAIALDGEGHVALSQTPTVFNGTNAENTDIYDLELAKKYLADSGVDVEGLSIPCVVSTDTARKTAEIIQANLSDLGIEVTIDSMDYAAYLQAIMGANYIMAVSGYTSNDFNYFTSGLFHSGAIGASNLSQLRDDEIDDFIELARTQLDEAERVDTYAKISARLNDLTPFVPLYESVVTRAYNKDLGGVEISATGQLRFEDVYWK